MDHKHQLKNHIISVISCCRVTSIFQPVYIPFVSTTFSTYATCDAIYCVIRNMLVYKPFEYTYNTLLSLKQYHQPACSKIVNSHPFQHSFYPEAWSTSWIDVCFNSEVTCTSHSKSALSCSVREDSHQYHQKHSSTFSNLGEV